MKILLSVIIALQATFSLAREVQFDTAAVTAACKGGGDTCLAAVQSAVAEIEASGNSPTDLNSQLGALAVLLLELAMKAPIATLAVFAQAMNTISEASTDPVQKAAIASLVADLNAGDVPATLSAGGVNGLSNS